MHGKFTDELVLGENPLNNIRMDLGIALRKLRVINGYTQQFLANTFKVSRIAYVHWEKNKVNLTVKQCCMICNFYGIKLSLFIADYLED